MVNKRKNKQSIAMQIFIGIILAVSLVGLANLGISAFYEQPDYGAYCGSNKFAPPILPPQDTCVRIQIVNEGEQECYAKGGYPEYTYDSKGCPTEISNCNLCNTYYEQAQQTYNNHIFYILLVIGLVLAITGIFVGPIMFQIAGLGAGSSLIIEGIFRNLDNKIMAFIAGLFIVIILAYVAWKKFGGKK